MALLHNITLQFEMGGFYSILGHSGSGKTSFLRLLNRLDTHTSGEILFKGQEISTFQVPELRRKIAMLFQKSIAIPGTVLSNFMILKNFSNNLITAEMIHQILDSVNIPESILNQDISTLSGGELQRIALARVLLNKPEILLLDEPTSSLDVHNRFSILKMIDTLRLENNITVIMVTHSPEDIKLLKTPFIIFENGVIKQQGLYTELLENTFINSRKEN